MSLFIGADLGTSALKLMLSDGEKTLNVVSKTYEVSYPKDGWSEQSPQDWWEAFVSGVKSLIDGFDKSQVKAIALAGQMHGLVALDEKDEVIRPAILWNDGRTGAETAYLNEVIGQTKLSNYTANVAFAGFTAPKIIWLKKNEPENFKKIKKIMLPKDYLNYMLTGVYATDYSDASGTLLLDVRNKRWSKEMCEICSVKDEWLPTLYESYQKIGVVKKEIASLLGLGDGVVVAAGAGDNAGAAIGTFTVGDGKCNISLGTSGTIFISSERFGVDESNSLHSFCHADGGYHLMGCMLSAASCNKWFCDEVLKSSDYALEQAEIKDDELGRSGVFFLPYLTGERCPYNDINASGTFIGLRPSVTRKDMVLAVLEGVSFAIRDNIEVAKSIGVNISESTVCGGGAKSKLWLKILSAVLNIPLKVPMVEEGPALGAVRLAAFASGEKTELAQKIEVKEIVYPDGELVRRYEEKYKKFRKIYPTMKNLFKEIK